MGTVVRGRDFRNLLDKGKNIHLFYGAGKAHLLFVVHLMVAHHFPRDHTQLLL